MSVMFQAVKISLDEQVTVAAVSGSRKVTGAVSSQPKTSATTASAPQAKSVEVPPNKSAAVPAAKAAAVSSTPVAGAEMKKSAPVSETAVGKDFPAQTKYVCKMVDLH